jgi:hypothetical protein
MTPPPGYCAEYVVRAGDILDAGKGLPGKDSGSVDQLGIRNMELVGEKAARRDPGYSDSGRTETSFERTATRTGAG